MSAQPEKMSNNYDIDDHGTSVDIADIYYDQISRVALLTAEQEVELSQRIEAGLYAAQLIESQWDDEDSPLKIRAERYGISVEELLGQLDELRKIGEMAKERFVEANLRLVVKIAYRMRGRGLAVEDLIQEGNAGLMHAVEKFDYTKGFKFSTYATNWIKVYMSRSIDNAGSTIRIPIHMSTKITKIKQAATNFNAEHNREPTIEELARILDLPKTKIEEYTQNGAIRVDSLDRPIGEGEKHTLGDVVDNGASDNGFDTIDSTDAATQLLGDVRASLTEHQYEILVHRHGLIDGQPKSAREVGEILGISHASVHAHEKRIARKIQQNPSLVSMFYDVVS